MKLFDYQLNGLRTSKFSCNFWKAPDDDSINRLCDYLSEDGIEGFYATLISSDPEQLLKNLKRIQDFKEKHLRKDLAGVHIEGGMISRLGVHPEKYSKSFDLKLAQKITSQFPGLIKLWTLCPIMDKEDLLTKFLQSQSITVSYGHSNASYEVAKKAFESNKVDMVTHWGNALLVYRGFKQRNTPKEELRKLRSLIELDIDSFKENDFLLDLNLKKEDLGIGLAALKNPNIKIMIICGSEEDRDLHLDPKLIKILYELKADKLILVSDSVEANPEDSELKGGRVSLAKHYKNFQKIISDESF
jgi:N-acetylglucosamine-6-phosphate deacetylase